MMPTRISSSDSGSGCHGACGRSPSGASCSVKPPSPPPPDDAAALRRRRSRLLGAAARRSRSPAGAAPDSAVAPTASLGGAGGRDAPRRLRERARRGLLRFATALARSGIHGSWPSIVAPMLGAMSTFPPAAERDGAGIPGSSLPGPYAVGEYARKLRDKLRSFQRVQLVGELVNLRPARARVYFELRDGDGAMPCAAWRADWEAMLARAGGAPEEGMQVVLAGGCDFYPGSASASPGFSFA